MTDSNSHIQQTLAALGLKPVDGLALEVGTELVTSFPPSQSTQGLSSSRIAATNVLGITSLESLPDPLEEAPAVKVGELCVVRAYAAAHDLTWLDIVFSSPPSSLVWHGQGKLLRETGQATACIILVGEANGVLELNGTGSGLIVEFHGRELRVRSVDWNARAAQTPLPRFSEWDRTLDTLFESALSAELRRLQTSPDPLIVLATYCHVGRLADHDFAPALRSWWGAMEEREKATWVGRTRERTDGLYDQAKTVITSLHRAAISTLDQQQKSSEDSVRSLIEESTRKFTGTGILEALGAALGAAAALSGEASKGLAGGHHGDRKGSAVDWASLGRSKKQERRESTTKEEPIAHSVTKDTAPPRTNDLDVSGFSSLAVERAHLESLAWLIKSPVVSASLLDTDIAVETMLDNHTFVPLEPHGLELIIDEYIIAYCQVGRDPLPWWCELFDRVSDDE